MKAKYITVKKMSIKVNLTDKYSDLFVFFNGQHDFLIGERGEREKPSARAPPWAASANVSHHYA
jgi:hypothetical protein